MRASLSQMCLLYLIHSLLTSKRWGLTSFPTEANRKLNLKNPKQKHVYSSIPREGRRKRLMQFPLFFKGKKSHFIQKLGERKLLCNFVRWIIQILSGENKTSSFKIITVIRPLSAAAASPFPCQRELEPIPADTRLVYHRSQSGTNRHSHLHLHLQENYSYKSFTCGFKALRRKMWREMTSTQW